MQSSGANVLLGTGLEDVLLQGSGIQMGTWYPHPRKICCCRGLALRWRPAEARLTVYRRFDVTMKNVTDDKFLDCLNILDSLASRV